MTTKYVSCLLADLLLTSLFMLGFAATAMAQSSESVLHTFTFHKDGGMPFAGLTFDAKGNLYGTAYYAGYPNEGICCGTVFQFTPNGSGGWTFNVISTFMIGNGEAPSGSVVFDSKGNLYGTTQEGLYCGDVYELSPTEEGPWKETVLFNFDDYKQGEIQDGCVPSSYLIFDKKGNLYGTTQQTGLGGCTVEAGCGTVFELSPGSGGEWKESVLHYFPSESTTDGGDPYGGLVFDKAGNLWGTSLSGGTGGGGTIYELSPTDGGGWVETVAFNFSGNDTGYFPYAGLVIDSQGNLYGTTYYGGSSGAGLVYKMTPQVDGQLVETIIHDFAPCGVTECSDGQSPFGGLVFDVAGDLYGTTETGGGAGQVCHPEDSNFRVGCGIVFKLTPGSQGTWDYSIVYRFPGGPDGAYLTDDHLAVDSYGNVYGTTFVEGDVSNNSICPQAVLGLGGCGVVFQLTPK